MKRVRRRREAPVSDSRTGPSMGPGIKRAGRPVRAMQVAWQREQ
jgi:hypothetical protein